MTTKRKQKPMKNERTYATAQKVEAYLAKEPELRDALKLFDVGMKQYAEALAHLNRPQIVTTASSTPV